MWERFPWLILERRVFAQKLSHLLQAGQDLISI